VQMRKQGILLKYEPDAPLLGRHMNRWRIYHLTPQLDASCLWSLETSYNAQGGCLAATAWTQNGKDFIGINLKSDVVHYRISARCEAFREVLHIKNRIHFVLHSRENNTPTNTLENANMVRAYGAA